MEQNFQTSFIPKKPIVRERSNSPQSIGILLVVSLFILFAALLSTGLLYFYKGVVTKSIAGMENNLNLAKNRFEPARISELQVLDKRLRASSDILSKHIVITPIFTALEQLTMKTVRYTRFSHAVSSEKDGMVNVQMSGVAVGYRSIALQSDLLGKNKNFINPIFSNLTLDNSGNVMFDLEFSVDPSFVNYKQTFLTEN
jgi:hypothetical protein